MTKFPLKMVLPLTKVILGIFSECQWELKAKGKGAEWDLDYEMRQGWTGTSKIDMIEQSKLNFPPLPEWLERRRSRLDCLANKVGLEDPGDHDPKLVKAEAQIL